MPPSPARFELQNLLLRECFSTAVPDLLTKSPAPASIWVTPPSRDAKFNRFFIENSLCFLLAPRPGRLRARCIDVGVFQVTVASRNIANVLVVRGVLRIGSIELFLHPTMAAARLAFERLPHPPPTLITPDGTQPANCPGTSEVITFDLGERALPSPPAMPKIRFGKVPQDLLSSPALTLPHSRPLPLAVAAATGLVPGFAAVANVAPALNAAKVSLPRSYLQAVTSAAPPKQAQVITVTRPASLSGCFRCLAKDHQVQDCRDPIRCRSCLSSGHRSPQCKMPLRRLLRVASRRLPPAVRTIHASPSARLSPSPLPLPLPPTISPLPTSSETFFPSSDDELDTLLLEAAASAMAPANCVPSTSSSADVGKAGSPPCQDKHVLPASVRLVDQVARVGDQLPAGAPASLPAAVSDASAPTPLPLPPTSAASWPSRGIGAGPSFSSEEEFASGDPASDDSSSDVFSWQEGRASHADAWVSPGRPELCERMLYAFIEPPVHPDEVSACIRAALLGVAPLVPVDLLPSSHGAMLLRATSAASRDSLRLLSPIAGDGFTVFLQKPHETANRFFRVPTWLAFVAVVDFPLEHWYEDKIRECFRAFAAVAEIDPLCLSGEHFGPLRLLLELNDRLELPLELRISARNGAGRDGAVARILPIRVWPREFQLNSRGELSPFFGPPSPPSPGPSLGPQALSARTSRADRSRTSSAPCTHGCHVPRPMAASLLTPCRRGSEVVRAQLVATQQL